MYWDSLSHTFHLSNASGPAVPPCSFLVALYNTPLVQYLDPSEWHTFANWEASPMFLLGQCQKESHLQVLAEQRISLSQYYTRISISLKLITMVSPGNSPMHRNGNYYLSRSSKWSL